MSIKIKDKNSAKQILEIEHLIKGRYFNRSAAIAKMNQLMHFFPESRQILEKYDLDYDLPVIYKNNDELKNILIEFRILIEKSDES